MEELTIKLGSNIIPRYSCSCHKCNITVRKAIKMSKPFARDLRKLSKYAGRVHRSNNLSRIFQELKSKLRNENLTRWDSSFLMLWSFYKAHKKGCFTGKQSFFDWKP